MQLRARVFQNTHVLSGISLTRATKRGLLPLVSEGRRPLGYARQVLFFDGPVRAGGFVHGTVADSVRHLVQYLPVGPELRKRPAADYSKVQTGDAFDLGSSGTCGGGSGLVGSVLDMPELAISSGLVSGSVSGGNEVVNGADTPMLLPRRSGTTVLAINALINSQIARVNKGQRKKEIYIPDFHPRRKYHYSHPYRVYSHLLVRKNKASKKGNKINKESESDCNALVSEMPGNSILDLTQVEEQATETVIETATTPVQYKFEHATFAKGKNDAVTDILQNETFGFTRRQAGDDCSLVKPDLLIVADGVGGYNQHENASSAMYSQYLCQGIGMQHASTPNAAPEELLEFGYNYVNTHATKVGGTTAVLAKINVLPVLCRVVPC